MIKFMVRWCTCSMWRMLLPCGKLVVCCSVSPPLSPFYFVFSRTEFARPVMGTIKFLVV